MAFNFSELDQLSILQCSVTITNYGTEMNEKIGSALTLDKPISLSVIKPLDGACLLFSHLLIL